MTKRAIIRTEPNGKVYLGYTSATTGEWVEHTYRVGPNGGYVFDDTGHQPCNRLEDRGNTLMCSSRDKLEFVIRREYRAMRRAEKRDGF